MKLFFILNRNQLFSNGNVLQKDDFCAGKLVETVSSAEMNCI